MSSVVATNPSSSSAAVSAAALSISSLESTIQRMLSHPQMFNGFIDILKLPVVQSSLSTLANNNSDPQKQRRHDALIRTVELFAYGSVGEYHDLISKEEGGGVWSLNEVMLEKLRMVTVVSVVARRVNGGGNNEEEMGKATKNCDVERHVEMKMADAALSERTQIMAERSNRGKRNGGKADNNATMLSIPYSHLASELRMPYTKVDVDDGINNDMASQETTTTTTKNIRQLEDLLIKCIYSNIISAKLDQLSQCLIVQPQLMLDNTGGDFVGWETFFGTSSSSSSVDNGDDDENGCGSKGGGRVHGSILSRDLHTLTPESTMVEITRMSSSLQNFLERSNILLVSLERLSNTTIVHHRKVDEIRWAEVRKVVEEAPSKMREMSMTMASPASSSSLTHQSSVAFASTVAANSPSGERSNTMRVRWGGTTGGGFDGGETNLMEVVDVMGSSGSSSSSRQRQVKRSKGGHSMMMERYGQ